MNSVLEITWIFALNFRKQNKTIEFTVIFMKGLGMAYTLNAIKKYLKSILFISRP